MSPHRCSDTPKFCIVPPARSAAQAPLLEELREVCGERLHGWFSAEGQRFDPATLGPPEDGVHLYACGPQHLTAAVQALRWPAEQVHVEHFAPLVDRDYTPESFDVRIASTGAILHVPAETPLLEVLRRNGVKMPSSCEISVCCACECGYREGDVIHRDVVLP